MADSPIPPPEPPQLPPRLSGRTRALAAATLVMAVMFAVSWSAVSTAQGAVAYMSTLDEFRVCDSVSTCATIIDVPCDTEADGICMVTVDGTECRFGDDLGPYCEEALRRTHGWKEGRLWDPDPITSQRLLPWIVGGIALLAVGTVASAVIDRRRRQEAQTSQDSTVAPP